MRTVRYVIYTVLVSVTVRVSLVDTFFCWKFSGGAMSVVERVEVAVIGYVHIIIFES